MSVDLKALEREVLESSGLRPFGATVSVRPWGYLDLPGDEDGLAVFVTVGLRGRFYSSGGLYRVDEVEASPCAVARNSGQRAWYAFRRKVLYETGICLTRRGPCQSVRR